LLTANPANKWFSTSEITVLWLKTKKEKKKKREREEVTLGS